ncbi:MAG: TatD family hydrolase [Patescibacteria group bacterium]
MRALDSHAHLDFPDFDKDREALIAELAEAEIGVINIATDKASLARVDQLSRDNPLIWGAVGIHPTEVGPKAVVSINEIIGKLAALREGNPKIVALGEIGLDYFHSQEHVGDQKVVLGELLNYAREHDSPVIFHCRDAYGDLLTILARYPGLRGVVHCFSGNAEQAAAFLDFGLHLSFTAMLTYKANDSLREIARDVPLEKLLLETDAPFLAPQSRRGERNDPRTILEIAQLHGELRNVSTEEILRQTTANAIKLFGLKDAN